MVLSQNAMIGLVIAVLLPALTNGMMRMRSGTRIRRTHPRITWNSVVIRSYIDARFPQMTQTGVPRAAAGAT